MSLAIITGASTGIGLELARIARAGYDAMLAGRTQMTPGLKNKVQAAAAEILPAGVVAKLHRQMAKPPGE